MADPQTEFQEAQQQTEGGDDGFAEAFGSEDASALFQGTSQTDGVTRMDEFPEVQEQQAQQQQAQEGQPSQQATQEPTQQDQGQKSFEQEGEPVPENVDDPDSYKYYQSKYHQTEQELEQAREQLQEFQQLEPIARYIQQDPEILDIVEQRLRGEETVTPQADNSQRQSSDSLPEKPERPSKPDDYDQWEAVNDPESESAEYQRQLTQYQEELAEWNEQVLDSKLNEVEQKEQEFTQRQQQRAQMQQVARTLQSEYDMGQDEVQDFMQVMSSPESRSLDNLVKLYQIQKGPDEGDLDKKRQAKRNQQRAEKKEQFEQTAASGPGVTDQQGGQVDSSTFAGALAEAGRNQSVLG